MAGIPRSEQGKLRRRMLDDAAELVMSQGFEALSLQAVRELGGAPVQSLYYYFRNKRTLQFELIDAWIMELLNSLDMPDDAPPEEQLARLCRSYAVAIDTDHLWHLAQLPLGRLSKRHQSIVRHKQAWLACTFTVVIQDCRPSLSEASATVLTRSLLALLNGRAAWSREAGALKAEEYAEMARRMVLSAAEPLRLAGP